MRTRIVSIRIDEENDGRKRMVSKAFNADAILLMEPTVAGEGFLLIVADLLRQLDGVGAMESAPPQTPKPEPEPEPSVEKATLPAPSRDPSSPGFTTKRLPKAKPAAETAA